MDNINREEKEKIFPESNNHQQVFQDSCNEIEDAVQVLEENLSYDLQEIADTEIRHKVASDEAIPAKVTLQDASVTDSSVCDDITATYDSSSNILSSFCKDGQTLSNLGQVGVVGTANNSLCVVCTEKIEAIPPVDEEIVVYFVEKFLAFSLLRSFNNAVNVDSCEVTIDMAKIRMGSPSTWISFCSSCLILIQDARKLFLEIVKLEEQLNNIRDRVTSKVNEKFYVNPSAGDDESNKQCCFTLFRNYIHRKMNGEMLNPSSVVEVKVKSEYPSDIEDFADTGIEWITEGELIENSKQEGSMSPSVDSIQLKDIIIDPLQNFDEPDEHLQTATASKWNGSVQSPETSLRLSDEETDFAEGFTSLQHESQRKTRSQSRAGQKPDAKKDNIKMDQCLSTEMERTKPENSLQSGHGSNDEFLIPSTQDQFEEELEQKPVARKPGRPKAGKRKRKRLDSLDSAKIKAAAALSIKIKDHRGMGKCTVESKTCPVCNRVFLNPSKMAVHYNIKHDRKILFNCEVCNRGFMRKDYLREHTKIHLSPEEKMLERTRKECGVRKKKEKPKPKIIEETGGQPSCTVCKTNFEDTAHLQRHVNYFHGKTEGYTCEVCDKKFQWKDALRKHMRLHDGTKKFKCDYEGCESAFYYKKHLEVHQRIHTGAKDFLCALCGISFRHEWSFNRHNIFKHHKVTSKTYLCETCGKSFKIKSHLDQHLQSKSHGGTGLKRRKRSRAKANNNTSSTRNCSNAHKDQGQVNVPMSSSTASSISESMTTRIPAVTPHPMSHVTLLAAAQMPSIHIPTLVLATNLNSTAANGSSRLQSLEQNEDDIPSNLNGLPGDLQTISEMENTQGTPNLIVPTTSNGLQLSITSSSSSPRDNEYLRYMPSMANTGHYPPHGLSGPSLSIQQLQMNSSPSQNIPHTSLTNPTVEESPPVPTCGSLPTATGMGSQISTIISHYQNYSNPFNFVVTESTNNQQNTLMQQNQQE